MEKLPKIRIYHYAPASRRSRSYILALLVSNIVLAAALSVFLLRGGGRRPDVAYELEVPGGGEIFPALADSAVRPLALLHLKNMSGQPVHEIITAQLQGWSRLQQRSITLKPHQVLELPLHPSLLPRAFSTMEVRRATLNVTAYAGRRVFEETRSLLLHPGRDIYWGRQFQNARFVARWVTPYDPAVLKLISMARQYAPEGHLAGYAARLPASAPPPERVEDQVRAIFQALRQWGTTYVNSPVTFGKYSTYAQRIRLPSDTLKFRGGNCIDLSVLFASAVENLGLDPVIVIVSSHSYVGIRLAPASSKVLYLDLTVLPQGTFRQAIARAAALRRTTPADHTLTVDVAAARKMGIYPLPAG